MGGAGFAEVLHDLYLINGCDYGGKVRKLRLLCCVSWAGLEGALERFLRMYRSFLSGGLGLSKSSETCTLSWRSLDGRESSIRHQDLGTGGAKPIPQRVRPLSLSCPPEPCPGRPITEETM